ncbi:MAG: coniferyl aldehyde dehydrogenase [Pseudomonadota bacterium]
MNAHLDPTTLTEPASQTSVSELRGLLERQQAAFAEDPNPDWPTRKGWLKAVGTLVDRHADRFVEAIAADFGHRAHQETRLAELMTARSAITHAKRHTKGWMKGPRTATPLTFWPGKARVITQPKGVAGIVSPWNYPLQLALVPAIAALSAGNRVMLKPSELTPRFSEALRVAVEEHFDADVFTVVTGEVELATAFTSLPFDHLFFTGSTAVGKKVGVAAMEKLVPVTLELGGKSPVILDETADMELAAQRITYGKLLNCGQTCVAPDYLIMPETLVTDMIARLKTVAQTYFPSLDDNPDLTTIVSDRHFKRLQELVADAEAKGATVHRPTPQTGEYDLDALAAQRRMPLTILTNVTPEMAVMQEEIFGPLLPIVTAETTDAALNFIAKGERPLALYWFGNDAVTRERILNQSISGTAAINDTTLQVAVDEIPFGGIGASGMGAYHGRASFDTFSHQKGVFIQSKLSATKWLMPPYRRRSNWLISFLNRWV